MVVEKFKKIYKLAEELQTKYYKEEYENIKRIDSNIGTFEEYLDTQLEKFNKDNNKSSDSIVLKDAIKKDNLIINIYLMKFKQIESVQLDEEYKVLPLEEKIIYQYGAIITMPIEEGFIDINDVFCNYAYEEEQAKEDYKNLKKFLNDLTEDELLNRIEKDIKNELFL